MRISNILSLLWLTGLALSFFSCKDDVVQAQFEIENNGCEAPCEVVFKNESKGATSFIWLIDDSTFEESNEENPSHEFTQSGAYTVKLIAIGRDGGRDETEKAVAIKGKGDEPIACFDVENNNCDAPCEVKFNNCSLDATEYEWEFGDGNSSSRKNPSHTYESAGTYEVRMTAYDDNGAKNRITKSVTIRGGSSENVKPCFSISNNNCEASCEIRFSNCSEGASKYEWNFGDGNNSTSKDPSHTYASAGSYQVKLTASNNDGQSESITKTVNIEEGELATPEACFEAENNGCEASCTIYFENCSEDAIRYEWDFDDGNTSTSTNPSHTYREKGRYEVSLLAYNADGDFGEYRVEVTIEEGEPLYSKAYIKKIEVYDMYITNGIWDPYSAPDVFYGISDGSEYVSTGSVIFNPSSPSFSWTYNSPFRLSNNERYVLHFFDDDRPASPTYIGRSAYFEVQDWIDDGRFRDVIDISYPSDGNYVRLHLEWE